MSKQIPAQMKTHTFDPFNLISSMRFFCSFKIACDTNEIHDGAAMWIFHFYMKKAT